MAQATVDAEPKLQGQELENTLASIKAIEGLFHAVNAASFPMVWHDQVMAGMGFLKQLHTGLVSNVPAEELAKAKAAHEKEQADAEARANQAPAPHAAPAPSAPPSAPEIPPHLHVVPVEGEHAS